MNHKRKNLICFCFSLLILFSFSCKGPEEVEPAPPPPGPWDAFLGDYRVAERHTFENFGGTTTTLDTTLITLDSVAGQSGVFSFGNFTLERTSDTTFYMPHNFPGYRDGTLQNDTIEFSTYSHPGGSNHFYGHYLGWKL